MTCRSCGATVSESARFCSNCGASQAGSDERRVVTALFADIVGFTTLAEHLDPEDVKRLVDRCFELLARDITSFGGVVDKVMGDGIVALFGAPTAHEDDAQRAVRAALRMQATVGGIAAPDNGPATPSDDDPEPIRIRIGVNTGEVLVGTSTAGRDYTAMGDVMNTASRLEKLAEPGQILVGESTHRLTSHVVRYHPLGPLEAKGREGPLEAWIALEATRPPGSHRQGGERFVGRVHELGVLESQARLAFELRQSQLSLVVGEAGMGKTRLVQQFADRLRRRYDAEIWRGHCVPYGEANVWWPVAEIIRQLFGLDLDASQAETERVIASELGERLDTNDASHLDRCRTALLHAMGFPTVLRGGEPTQNRSEVTQAFSQLLEGALADGPVVMLLSDMHWAGDAVWDLFDRLLNQWSRHQLMIVATARVVDRAGLISGRHGASIVQLGPLNDSAARELLAGLHKPGDKPLDPETVEDLVARSGGNPFFLEELAGLVLRPGAAGGGGGANGELPDTLRGIIAARLDSLTAGERALLEDAAILGRSGPLEGLTLLSRQRRRVASVDDDLNGLVDQDFLVIDGSRYEFRSELVRDVAYGTLTKAARADRHRDIARYLERLQSAQMRNSVVVAIADHYRSAARLSLELMLMDEPERAELVSKAVYWLRLAGERALAGGEGAEAEAWFGSGLDMAAGDERTEARFLFGRARARCEIRDIVGARADLKKLDQLVAHDPLLAAKALMTSGDVNRKAGDLAAAAQELREAADKLAVLGAGTEQSLALRLLGLTEMARSNDLLARQAFQSSRIAAAQVGDRRAEAWTLQSMAWLAFSQGRVHDANQQASTAIEIFVELGDRSGLAWAQGVQAWVAFHLGRLTTAQELVDVLLPTVRRRGDPWAEAMMTNLAASLALWTGRAAESVRLCNAAVEAARRADDVGLEIQTLAVQGRALVSLGRITDGSFALEMSYQLADRERDQYNRRIAIIANCASAARVGEYQRALRWASNFQGFHDDLSVVGEADLIVSVSLALLQRGSVAEAGSQLAWFDGSDNRRVDYFAEAVRAILAAVEGRLDDADTAVDRVLNGHSTYLDRINAHLVRACVALQRGDEPATDASIDDARQIVEVTDDRMSRWLIDLVAGICGRGDQEAAERDMASAGLDATGLVTAWRLTARSEAIEAS